MLKAIIFLFLLTSHAALYAKEEIRFGVFAYMGYEDTKEKYQPLVDYLNKKLDKKVVLDVLSQDEIDQKIKNGDLDIVTTNPTHFLVIRQHYKLSGAVATLITETSGVTTSKLGGLIIVNQNSKINTLEDIKGKTIMTPSTKHMGGFRAQAYELYKVGVDVTKGGNKIIETKASHQDVVRGIIRGDAEVGFIRDGIIEKMLSKKELQREDIRVINEQKQTGHPFTVSTNLYPEWPVFALPNADENDVKHFVAALFSIQPSSEYAITSDIHGYALPADYLEVEQLARALKLPPFDHVQKITYADIWNQYKISIALAAVALMALFGYYAREQKRTKLIKSLLLNMGDGAYGVDKNSKCTWINNKALDMLGYKKEDVLGKDQHLLFHHTKPSKEPYEASECPIYLTLQDRQARTCSEHFIKKDGTLFPVDMTAAPIEYGGGVIVIFRDISERIRKESIIRQNEAKFRTIFEHSHDGLAIINPKTQSFIHFNDTACEQLGYTRAEFESIKITDVEANESEEETRKRIERIESQGWDSFETNHKTKSGELLDVFVTVQIIELDEDTALFATFRNITEQKAIERQILASKEKAEEASRVKSQFLANMSHEIRTPMNAIIGLSELAMDENDTKIQQEYFKKINSSSRLLLGIINDILDYSKIEAGKLQLESAVFEIDDVVSQLATLFVKNAADKRIDLFFDIHPDVPKVVVGDMLRIDQVLTNLISNAIKFTKEGYVKLTITPKSISSTEAILQFSVKDTGIGMSEVELSKLFTAFSQADISTTRKYGGTGLGLTIAKRIINAMGGDITVKSEPGFGSEFTFELTLQIAKDGKPKTSAAEEKTPTVDASIKEKEKIQKNNNKALDGISILIVEDNELNQEIAKKMLTRMGATIDIANNGKEGVERLAANHGRYDIVLMDIQMPIMGGYEAAQIIRKTEPNLPIIALTAAAMIEDTQKAITAGMNDHISKPIDIEQLSATVLKWSKKGVLDLGIQKHDVKNDDAESSEMVMDYQALSDALGGDEELLVQLLTTFESDLSQTFDTLPQMIRNNDSEASAVAHSLKGVAGNMYAKRVYKIAAEIDGKLRKGEKIEDTELAILEEELALSIQSIRSKIEQYHLA